MLHWQCLQIRAIRTSYSRCGLLQSGPNLARLVWFIAAIVATASQFPANETKFFGVWHKSSFQLARATAAAAAELVQFILARSLLFGCSVSQAGRQAVSRLYKMDLLPTVELCAVFPHYLLPAFLLLLL